jgi:hypothetical protein
VAVADFNNDGNDDVAVINFSSNTVSVLFGNGDGTLQPNVQYATGSRPVSLAVGDFNRDGAPDLAVGNGTTVSILLNKKDGTFLSRVEYAVQGAAWVTVGDFNEDGIPDLAVANDLDLGSINVLLGNGDGTFGKAVGYSTGLDSDPVFVITADFNHDSHLDLVAANLLRNRVAVLLGNGDGTFQGHVDYATVSGPRSLTVGDFNHDGNLDLAAVSGGILGLSILLGNGDGTFQPHTDYKIEGLLAHLSVADFNRDGNLDLAVTTLVQLHGHQAQLAVFPGEGDGAFRSPVEYEIGSFPYSAYSAVGDFNKDGVPDLVVSDSPTTIGIMLSFP